MYNLERCTQEFLRKYNVGSYKEYLQSLTDAEIIDNSHSGYFNKAVLKYGKELAKEAGVSLPSLTGWAVPRCLDLIYKKHKDQYFSILDTHLIEDMLSNMDVSFETDYSIDGVSYSFYIPEHNLLISVDDVLTNNVLFNTGVASSYLFSKSTTAHESGLRCIHLFEWDNIIDVLKILRPSVQLVSEDECIVDLISIPEFDMFVRMFNFHSEIRHYKVEQLYGVYRKSDQELLQVVQACVKNGQSFGKWSLVHLSENPEFRILSGFHKVIQYFLDANPGMDVSIILDTCKDDCAAVEDLGFVRFRKSNVHRLVDTVWVNGHTKLTTDKAIGYLDITKEDSRDEKQYKLIKNGWLPMVIPGTAEYRYYHQQ